MVNLANRGVVTFSEYFLELEVLIKTMSGYGAHSLVSVNWLIIICSLLVTFNSSKIAAAFSDLKQSVNKNHVNFLLFLDVIVEF